MRKIRSKFFAALILLFYVTVSSQSYPSEPKLSNPFSTDFKELFEAKGALKLSQGKEFIGSIRSFKIDEEGNPWILDSKKCNIKSYTRSGSLRFVAGGRGAGPGEYYKPLDFFLSKRFIYVLDPIIYRVHIIYRKNLKFSHFFKVRDSRFIHVIDDQKIILSAPLAIDPGEKPKRYHCLHVYNNKGVIERSFFPLNDDAIQNKMICDGIFFCIDKNSNIFAVQEMAYKIFNYTIDGTLIRSFANPVVPHYIPPPRTPLDKSFLESRVKKWLESWTHIVGIYAWKDFIIVNMFNYVDQDEKYFIDVYDSNGKFIKGGLESDYRLLNIDKDGTLYFLKDNYENEANVTIIKFVLREQKIGSTEKNMQP